MTNPGTTPRHVAVIMDGNGRWAKAQGQPRLEGHRAGAISVRKIVEESRRQGIRYLTLFSFSSENWGREPSEVDGLMSLFKQYLDSELEGLNKNGIRLRALGDIERLPKDVQDALNRDLNNTENNDGLDLILAVSYGSRDEIVSAAKKIALQVKTGEIDLEEIDKELFARNLWTHDIPDPDLLIRTSGEMRISNFLLYQLAYTEIIVAPELWPEFHEESFLRCLKEYASRERRYGLSSEQIASINNA
jgi:undecaprenyl diphosphate synthase